VIEKYQTIVEKNQEYLKFFKSRSIRTDYDQKINASFDYAVARMNTILLRLIQHPLIANELECDVNKCQETLSRFYDYVKKFDDSKWFKWYYNICLHGIGERQFPYIRSLLNTVEAKTRD
jgi:hypothetical protein